MSYQSKVSDFKLAESIIRKLCKKHGASFVDAPISFEAENCDNALNICDCKNVAHSIFKIVSEYINNSPKLVQTQLFPDEACRDDFLTVLASNLRVFVYGKEYPFEEEAHLARLYQYPLIWILMKDIICPIYKKNPKNVKIFVGDNYQVDIAKFFDNTDAIPFEMDPEPFIFVNGMENRVIQKAFIFIEAIRAHELSPIEVVKDIYGTDLYDKFKGLLDIAFKSDDEVNDFECTIMAILGVNFYTMISKKSCKFEHNIVKTAQIHNQFWQMGVLEKMMEPMRGSDWNTYKGLEPYVKDLWDKVEEVKKKRKKSGEDVGVPFDILLRIKTKQTLEAESDPEQTLQGLLSSDRVW